jgi:hypothetical protein
MTLQERILYHQVHPLKLLTDVTTAVLSLWLLAEGRLALALLVMFLPPVIVSVVVMRSVSLEDIKASALGRYVLRYMTPATTSRERFVATSGTTIRRRNPFVGSTATQHIELVVLQ